MKKQTMYLDITKKVGDQSAVKTSDQLIKDLEAKLKVAVEALDEAYELIRSTSYTIDNNNGNRCMNGNEYVWIDRGINVMKEALEKIKVK